MALPIQSVTTRNFLSFGPEAVTLELRALNILVGVNGSGKSNLLETLVMMHEVPENLATYLRAGGGSAQFIWRGGAESEAATVELLGASADGMPFSHSISFATAGQAYEIAREIIRTSTPSGKLSSAPTYSFEDNVPVFRVSPKRKVRFERDELNLAQSIISDHQENSFGRVFRPISKLYGSFRFYRARHFNQIDVARAAAPTDLPNRYLEPNGQNLASVLNRLLANKEAKKTIDDYMGKFYEGYEGIATQVQGGTIQAYLIEKPFRKPTPATRLSDGTMRWLALLAILADPDPAPLICLEEPETGLHPDAIVELAKLIREASERTQLIVTTHSETLIDCFTEEPEVVVVCERDQGATKLSRLVESDLRVWLTDYSLGKLWRRNQTGGNRW